jgi:hypothetical protein
MIDLIIIATGLLGAAVLANEARARKPKKKPVPIRSKRK